jgi:hypothetical protein
MASLTAAEEKIRNQIENNYLSYKFIGNVAQNNDKSELLNWLKSHDLFDRHVFVLMGVHNSNKWPLLHDELPQYYIQKKNPYGFALCYDLIEKDPDLKDFMKIAPTFDDRLSIYSWAISQLERFPYSPAAVLQYTDMEMNFGLNPHQFKLYKRVALPKFDVLEGITRKKEEKYDYRSVNLGALLLILNSLSALLESDVKQVDNFKKFLILSGFSKGNPILKAKFSTRFSEWAQLEESIISKYRDQMFPGIISRFKLKNFSPLFQLSDLELIETHANTNFYDSIIAFRVLQLRLHHNQSLDLKYEDIAQFTLLKDYINELAFLGIIEKVKYSEMFKWPEIGSISTFSYQTSDRFDKNKPETFLRMTGYKVGESGLPARERQMLLCDFFEGNSKVENDAIKAWDKANSAERLEKMAVHLARQIRNHRKLGNKKAVSDWKEDLQYLKDKHYYARRFKFKYPEV